MSKNDIRVNEKRWQRKRLFGKQAKSPALRFFQVLLVVAALAGLAWWLQMPTAEVMVGVSLP